MRTRETLTLLVGMWNSAAGSPQKAKSRVTVGPRHPFLGFIPKRSESVTSTQTRHTRGHGSIVLNVQKTEATRMPLSRGVGK